MLSVGTRPAPPRTVRIVVRTEEVATSAEARLSEWHAEVTRVAVNRPVEAAPPIRTEGDVTIVPVLEERLVVERRLVLTEELHIRRIRVERIVAQPVVLRRQVAEVVRGPAEQGSLSMETTDRDVKVLTALFDNRAEAERATEALVQRGIPREHISLHANEPTAGTTPTRETGLLGVLKNMFLPEEDRTTYAEGVRRGGVLLVAEVGMAEHDAAIEALEASNAIDLDDRASGWREDSWQAGTGAGLPANAVPEGGAREPLVAPGTEAGMRVPGNTVRDVPEPALARGTDPLLGEPSATPAAATGRLDVAGREEVAGREDVIPVAEERLRIGKRDTTRRTLRVRSYVVERPVEEQVTLHEERVDIAHRPTDRAVEAGEDPFRERTVEVTETGEEAVVSKEARIREEVVVNKTGTDRVETVRDTVRRTEVEVEGDKPATTTPPRTRR